MARIGIYGRGGRTGGHCAATVEHDGGALRKWVEGFARFDPERPPGDEPTRRWLPHKFLEATLLELRKHGILESRCGRGGGYRLTRPAHSISFGEVIRIIDGPLAPLPCASLTQFRLCADCSDPSRCSIRWLMQQVCDATAGVLDVCTLADALGKAPREFPINQILAQPTPEANFEHRDDLAPYLSRTFSSRTARPGRAATR